MGSKLFKQTLKRVKPETTAFIKTYLDFLESGEMVFDTLSDIPKNLRVDLHNYYVVQHNGKVHLFVDETKYLDFVEKIKNQEEPILINSETVEWHQTHKLMVNHYSDGTRRFAISL